MIPKRIFEYLYLPQKNIQILKYPIHLSSNKIIYNIVVRVMLALPMGKELAILQYINTEVICEQLMIIDDDIFYYRV